MFESRPTSFRIVIVASVVLLVGPVLLLSLDLSSEPEPSWLEKMIATNVLALNIRLRQPATRKALNSDQDLRAVGEMYDQQCSYCHGTISGGVAPLARSFSPRPPQFAIEASKNPTWMDAFAVRHGIRWSAMPAFREISEDDAWRLALYVERVNQPD